MLDIISTCFLGLFSISFLVFLYLFYKNARLFFNKLDDIFSYINNCSFANLYDEDEDDDNISDDFYIDDDVELETSNVQDDITESDTEDAKQNDDSMLLSEQKYVNELKNELKEISENSRIYAELKDKIQQYDNMITLGIHFVVPVKEEK